MAFDALLQSIAAGATPGTPFPANIRWAFHATNLKQLRHYPDPFVRPGGVAFGGASATTPPITPIYAIQGASHTSPLASGCSARLVRNFFTMSASLE